MTDGYCEREDVRKALQERELDRDLEGPISGEIVEAAIQGISSWLARASGHHWYDSTADTESLLPTSTKTATATHDVPASPHRQHRQLYRESHTGNVRYPLQTVGPYAKVPLNYHAVQSIDTLRVRDVDGDVTDWVGDSDFDAGRGDDYYVEVRAENEYGRSHLYVNANSIGPRVTFDNLLRVTVSYGLDADGNDWQDVRRGVALLAASQLVVDDDVLTAIPDNGQLVNLETEREGDINDAVGEAVGLLRPYLNS